MKENWKIPVMLQQEVYGTIVKIHEALDRLNMLPFWRVIKRERELCEIRYRMQNLYGLVPEIPSKEIGNIELTNDLS